MTGHFEKGAWVEEPEEDEAWQQEKHVIIEKFFHGEAEPTSSDELESGDLISVLISFTLLLLFGVWSSLF